MTDQHPEEEHVEVNATPDEVAETELARAERTEAELGQSEVIDEATEAVEEVTDELPDADDEPDGDELPSDFDDELLDDPDYDADADADVDDADVPELDGAQRDAAGAGGRTAASESVTATAASVWRRAARAFMHPRLTGAGAIIAVLVGLLGFALIAQVTSNNSSSTLNNDRPDDLVRILSDLDSRKDRLDSEITSLQTQQQQLSSGALSKQAALNAATQRADELGILAGTLPAEGPGLVVRMVPSTGAISSIVVLETIEELRGAGAEAMEISGTNAPSVRVIASTWIGDGTGGILVDGVQLQGTLTITAIGDGQTMQTALSIPGGVADTVHDNGGTVLMQQEDRVQVTALAPTGTLKYAHPAS